MAIQIVDQLEGGQKELSSNASETEQIAMTWEKILGMVGTLTNPDFLKTCPEPTDVGPGWFIAREPSLVTPLSDDQKLHCSCSVEIYANSLPDLSLSGVLITISIEDLNAEEGKNWFGHHLDLRDRGDGCGLTLFNSSLSGKGTEETRKIVLLDTDDKFSTNGKFVETKGDETSETGQLAAYRGILSTLGMVMHFVKYRNLIPHTSKELGPGMPVRQI